MAMIVYSVLMFAAAVLFLGLAAAIYRGNTDLIHAHHQRNVKETDKRDYGKSFSKGLFVLAASLFISGIIALLGTNTFVVMISISVLYAGMIISFAVTAKVQKKFNGGF